MNERNVTDDDVRMGLLMVQYLESQTEKVPEDRIEDLQAAMRHISAAYGLDHNDPELFRSHSFYPTGLKEIVNTGVDTLHATVYNEKVEKASSVNNFDAFVDTVKKKGYFADTEEGSVEYLKRHAKVVTKFQTKVENTKAAKAADQTALADEKKSEGNGLLAKKKYKEAITCYSEAIALCPKGPSSHIYYCNRAAARCHMQEYRDAISDCKESIACKKDYTKAYSRLGLAHFFLKEYDDSIAAYEEGLQLEPNNQSIRDSLEQAKTAKSKEPSSTTMGTPNPSGMPDLSSLAGMMGGGGAGGMPDMSKIMQNPQMMAMAQEMMKNPQMMQQAMSMMQGMGGGGGGAGGMPDLSALAGMMGNMGGGGGGGSSGNGIPDFSGFNDDSKK